MTQPVQEIKSLGKHKVKIFTPAVDAEIIINAAHLKLFNNYTISSTVFF